MTDPSSRANPGTPEDSLPLARFGDIACELGLLKREQIDHLLEKQEYYQTIGINMRIDEIAVELGILARVDCNIVLKELKKRRKIVQGPADQAPPPKLDSGEESDLVPPCSLGHYEIEERIGGFMGTVFKAYDSVRQKRVALKMLPFAMATDRPLVERFQREVAAVSRLSHPNIVSFQDAGEIQGRFYLSMEYVAGRALSEVIDESGVLSEIRALEIVRDIALALAHAHQNQIIHRDVKPENILLDKGGRARLTDLGLVKILSDDHRLTESGLAIGTPHYISPEQARGAKVIDGRADLYGLGVTLFHLLCGRPPYDGNAAEVMRKHVFTDTPDPHLFNPRLGSGTHGLILKLMQKDPKDRIQTAAELAVVSERLLVQLRMQAPGAAPAS